MDLDYLHRRRREEMERAAAANSVAAREAHAALAQAYAARIGALAAGRGPEVAA
jgi:hypothetical protein